MRLPDPIRRATAAALAATLVPLAAGCYRYATVDRGVLGAGTNVRIHLTESGPDTVGRALRTTNGRALRRIDGTVLTADEKAYTLRVSRVARRGFHAGAALVDTVRVPFAAIADVRQEKLRAAPTAGLVGGAIAALVGIFLAAFPDGGGGGNGPGDERPPLHRSGGVR